MAKKGWTTYTLRDTYHFSHSTVQRLQKDLPVSTHTLDRLCRLLECGLEDVAQYVPDQTDPG